MVRFGKRSALDRSSMVRFGKRAYSEEDLESVSDVYYIECLPASLPASKQALADYVLCFSTFKSS